MQVEFKNKSAYSKKGSGSTYLKEIINGSAAMRT